MKPLVVFYSRTGTTKKVGEALANLLQCDSEELIDTKKRKGPLGFLRSGRDAARNKLTVLAPIIHDPALYDVVALGTPVWSGLMSSPMRTYITINKSKFNRVAFFCTQGGNENRKLFDDMQALCGRSPVSVLALRASVVKNEEYERETAAICWRSADSERRKCGHNVGRSVAPGTSRLAFLKRLFYSVACQIKLSQWAGRTFCGL